MLFSPSSSWDIGYSSSILDSSFVLDSSSLLDSSVVLVQYCNCLHDCYFRYIDPPLYLFSYDAITARGQVTSLDVIFLVQVASSIKVVNRIRKRNQGRLAEFFAKQSEAKK